MRVAAMSMAGAPPTLPNASQCDRPEIGSFWWHVHLSAVVSTSRNATFWRSFGAVSVHAQRESVGHAEPAHVEDSWSGFNRARALSPVTPLAWVLALAVAANEWYIRSADQYASRLAKKMRSTMTEPIDPRSRGAAAFAVRSPIDPTSEPCLASLRQ